VRGDDGVRVVAQQPRRPQRPADVGAGRLELGRQPAVEHHHPTGERGGEGGRHRGILAYGAAPLRQIARRFRARQVPHRAVGAPYEAGRARTTRADSAAAIAASCVRVACW